MLISSVHGSFGEHLGRPKIAHGSHNDVRRLCELGLRKPPSGNPEGLPLLGEPVCVWGGGGGVWLGGTDRGDCGRKASTQRKYACVFAGSDVRGKCKRITFTLSSVLKGVYAKFQVIRGFSQKNTG